MSLQKSLYRHTRLFTVTRFRKQHPHGGVGFFGSRRCEYWPVIFYNLHLVNVGPESFTVLGARFSPIRHDVFTTSYFFSSAGRYACVTLPCYRQSCGVLRRDKSACVILTFEQNSVLKFIFI